MHGVAHTVPSWPSGEPASPSSYDPWTSFRPLPSESTNAVMLTRLPSTSVPVTLTGSFDAPSDVSHLPPITPRVTACSECFAS